MPYPVYPSDDASYRRQIKLWSNQSPARIDTYPPVCVNLGSPYSTNSGHGTMVDLTVFIAIASATACPMPVSENG
jgi:hypothetical protein